MLDILDGTLDAVEINGRGRDPSIDWKIEVATEAQAIAGSLGARLICASRVTFNMKHLVTNRDRLSHAATLARGASFTRAPEEIQMMSQAEIGLVKIDENIADADRYIRELGALVPLLAAQGYRTTEIEEILPMLWQALHGLQVQRRAIVEMLDGDELPPRIARPVKRARR
jgi:hypothetical protein